jgi:molybdate transport repressor ModE-like protein
MRLIPALAWSLDDPDATPIDGRILPLLRAVEDTGSLGGAAAKCGCSYRAVWGWLQDYEAELGAPLVTLERGRGASLSTLGRQLVAADEAARARLSEPFAELALDLAPKRPKSRGVPALAVGASHDFVLAALRDRLALAPEPLRMDLGVMGSLEALEQYCAGTVEVAGFHLPLDLPHGEWTSGLRELRARRDRLIRFVDREQGLIVRRGNPHRLASVADVARKKLRFVNRQRGSGTRLLLDALLDREGIAHEAIVGYGNEEFTHAAVAATVASGGADAGFGLQAAAARYKLGFVPLARERYWLAARASALRSAALPRLIQALREPAFATLVEQFPGYTGRDAGSVTSVDAVLRND